MLNYIQSHDFKSFAEQLNKYETLHSDDLVEWLSASVIEGLEPFVALLLAKGANPNSLSRGAWWNPIHLAIEYGHIAVFEILIKAGADVENPDGSGFTPLHHAVDMEADGAYQLGEEPTPEFSRRLLEAGANPLATDTSGMSVMELAR